MSTSYPLCPEHNLPLVRHALKHPITGKIVGHCWDCPGKMTRKQFARFQEAYGKEFRETYDPTLPCFYHVHED